MQIKLINALPNGFPLVTVNDTSYEPAELLRPIFDIRHSLFDKLEAAPQIIYATKKDLRNLFSDQDKKILKEIKQSITDSETINFIDNTIKYNLIRYNDSPRKKVERILSIPGIKEKYPYQTYKTFTKWFDLANNGSQKIKTIINDRYMPFPSMFNDRFDCQLHLHDEEILELADNNLVNVPLVRFIYIMIKHPILVTSFSLNDPLLATSNHMWGLYGGNGKGIAITYALDTLIAFVLTNYQAKQGKEVMIFKPVKYEDSYNPMQAFQECITTYYKKQQQMALSRFFERFVITKTSEWQYERELRFYKYDLTAYEGFNNKYGLNVSEATCKGLIEHAENRSILVNHEQLFNRPISITLGWDCDEHSQEIIDLITYANRHKIPVVKLGRYINYKTNKFYTSWINKE